MVIKSALDNKKTSAHEIFFQAIIYGNPDYFPPMINAAAVLFEKGIGQEIICNKYYSKRFPPHEVEYPPNTRVKRLGTNSSLTWCNYILFVAHALRHANSKAAFFVGYDMHGFLVARLLATRFRRPLVYHSHDFVENGRKLTAGQWIVKTFEQKFARTADLIIVPDPNRADFMEQELRLRQRPLVVANAALKRPDKSSHALTNALAERGKQFSKIVFRQGYIANGHGIKQTLHSLCFWIDATWGFVIMGPGDESYFQELRQLASDLGVENQFEILPAVGYRNVADYTVGASLGHGLYDPIHINNRFITAASNKIMEYMAASLPVLLSDTPSNKAIIDRYQNGLLAQDNSPRSIADAVNTILGDSARAKQMGLGSSKAFTEKFNYSQQYAPAIERFWQLAAT